MLSDPLLSVIVPAFNEAGSIGHTLGAIRSFLERQGYSFEIIVSADGTDGTREKAVEAAHGDPRVKVIGSPERGGKGKGVRNGVLMARGRYVGFVDADYKTPIEEVEKLLPHLRRGDAVVIGSRGMSDSKIVKAQPLYRRLGSRAFAMVMRRIVGLYDVVDTQCGFKFFQQNVARALFTRQRIDGYMFDVEILRLARVMDYTITEVGVAWQDDGDSRYNPVSGTIRNARELLRIRFMRYPKTAADVAAAPVDDLATSGATPTRGAVAASPAVS
jgi:dolichyl-phosphate beta-glucosyltransferase